MIVDHNPEAFCERIPSFVDQIPEVDHLNLFLALIGYVALSSCLAIPLILFLSSRGHHSPDFIGKCCDAFRNELERRDLVNYVNSILTAYVVKTPPDHEGALSLLLRLRGA